MKNVKCILYLIGFSVCLTSCRADKKIVPLSTPEAVTAFVVKSQTIPATFEFVGVAKSSHPVEIRARVEGYLWSIDYEEGSAVTVGQPLFHLDPLPFKAKLEEAVASLAKEQAILWNANRSFQRTEKLFKKNAVSQKDLDDATAGVLASEANVLAAKANVVEAELNLGYTKILSPINGLSSRACYREGTLITPNANGLLTLISVVDPIWVLFTISDNELLKGLGEQANNTLILPEKKQYTVTLELSDGSIFPHKGCVNFSSPVLDADTGSMVIRASFPNPEKTVLPGQFVKAYVSGAIRPDAIFVPQKSVFQGEDGMYVFVLGKNNVARMRHVEVGTWYEDYWIIRKGLTDGEVVVADGTNKVTEGATVNVISTSTVPSPKISQSTNP